MHTLLSTKLNVPPTRQALVTRPDLTAILADAGNYLLTLISAPPGYGKTTLVSSWLRQTDLPFAWLSLDEGDNDPIRFLEYFLTALHGVVPAVRLDLLELRQNQEDVSFETLMALLINEIAGAGDFFMVLDDFQTLHTPSILDMVNFLVEHLPPAMHLVLLSRTDPPLTLHRLRARGQLLEIRAEQLRFTGDETARFFAEVMGLPLSAPDISALETRTEGWIAGLQLAGLAMQAEDDPQRFISAFTGSHAYIMDYLTEEVLRSQPDAMRSFLLQTSILDRMCGPLCETVVRSEMPDRIDSRSMLEAIERNHLFVVALDAERRWYRYHHLFKEVLSRRLEGLYSNQIAGLHCRASEWFEQHGFIHEAIQHSIKAGDTDRIARLVEQHGCDLLMRGEFITLSDWLASIDSFTHTRPWLAMQKAWVFLLNGQAEPADGVIDEGEQLISGLELTDEVRTLRGSFTAARALWANMQGNTVLAARYARHAIDLLSVSGDFSCALRSVATSLLGDSSWVEGKLDEARLAYEEAVRVGQISGNPHMTMLSLTNQADVQFEQGKLRQAARLYAESLQMAEQVDGPNSAYAPGAHFGLGKVFYSWNRLDDAAESVEKSRQLSLRWKNVNLQAACLALTALVDFARGRIDQAQSTAADAEELIGGHSLAPYWSVWVRTALARFWLAQGKIEKALMFLRDAGALPGSFLPDMPSTAGITETPVPYRLAPAYITLARVSMKLGSIDDVLVITDCLLQEAAAWGWEKAITELFILRALAFQASKDTASSLAALEKALALAWSEQSKRVFLDEGEAMGKLLYQAKARGIGGEVAADLLSLIDLQAAAAQSGLHPGRVMPEKPGAGRGQNFLVEPLSARELEILRCIADGFSNQEIADRLVLSLLTVKRHISNIYAKLEAKNRTQAVSLARTLKLMD